MPKGGLMIAGGGTGGHVFAGIAVADVWKSSVGGPILFVGAQGKIEEKLVPRAGYPLELLQLGSLKRVTLARRLKTFLQLPWSLIRSAQILFRERPQAVLGVGGYASGPLVMTARLLSMVGLLKARTAILEQNSVPGFTNRVLGGLVNQVFCAFPGTEAQFKNQSVRLTGNPVRNVMSRLPSAPRDPFVIFIFGGSQGSLAINTLVLEALPHLGAILPRLHFVHQTGEADHQRVLEGHKRAGTQGQVESFIHDMASVYAKSSLLICRSGSSTLAEIAAVGRASVLVPLPTASDNHQDKNARVFSDVGAAYLLEQSAGGEALARLIQEAVANPSKLDQMENAVKRFNRPDAARDIVQALRGGDA